MNERIKTLRKSLSLTQQSFGERVGLKQNSVAVIESGKRSLSGPMIRTICTEFNVNEEWLRTGEGEMFKAVPTSTLDALAAEYHLNDAERALLDNFIALAPDDRLALVEFVEKVAASLKKTASPDATNCDIPGGTVPAATL